MKIQSYVVMKEMETSLTTLLKYLVLTKYYFFIGLLSLLVCSLYWFVLPVSQVIIIHIVFLMQQDNAQSTQNQLNHINFNCHRYPHNVIAHRRVKTNKIKDVFSTQITQIHPTTQNTQQHSFTSSLAQSIIQQEQLSRFVEQDRLYTEQFQRKMKTLETNSKLFVKDKGLIRKQQLSQKYSNQKSYTSQTDWRKHKSKDRSKLTSLQKEKKKFPKELVVNRKGPLQQKHLINWLNFVISEYCLQDTTQNSVRGLQRFALDKNTLLSKGLTNQNIYRVYQTLFAHSFGLNGSVEQLCAHKRDVVKAIWKVYAFLLQYCSNGSFQTIMGQLQRDMISNQKRLIGEIQKRQAIINRNDEIMQQKLEKYQKQNKQLRNTVQNYEGKIQQLQTEFREIQIAYNMEVRLRLNYQHKINKIYSVHQRLNIIHHSLLRDFQETDAINKKMTVQNKKTVDKNIQLKADYKLAMDQIYDQINKLRENESTIQALKMNEEHWKEKLSREVAIKDNEKHELKQKDKKIGQLQNAMRGLNLMIEMMKNSANSQFEDYRRVSTQNAELKLINSSQLQKINELVNQINYLNKKESQINIELNYLVIKTEQLTEQLSKREDSINDLKIQLEKKEIELHARVVQLESLRKSDQSLKKNMKEMKTICEKFQQQANTQRKYATQINQQFTRTHQQKLQLELKMKYTLEQKFQMELDLNRRISEIITLKKKYQADNTQQIKKYEKLHNVWSGQDKNQLSMAEQLANVNQQLQKAKIRISFLSRQFSDLNFQKAQVQAMYKDNLILHQKEKRAEKDLMIDISTLREKLEDVTRQLTMQTRSHQHQVDNWLKEKDKLLATISQQKIQIQKKQAFVHPMLLEDALHCLQRQLQTHQRTRIRFENDLEMENQKYIKLKMEMQKKEAQFRQSLKDNEKKIEQTRSELQREREYFKVKTEELRTLNYTLQTRINYQKKEIEKKQDTQTKDDSKLLEIMKQKNAQIQQLLGELQRIEDNYQKKNVQYEQEIKSIYQQNQSTITNLKQQKKELQTQLGNIEKEYQTKLIQKQKKNQQAILALKKPKDADQPQNQMIRKGKSLTHASSQMKRSEFIAKLKIATILSKK